MNNQASFVERRERSRFGIMSQLEDVTYSVLRKYGLDSTQAPREISAAEPILTSIQQKRGDTAMASLFIISRNDQPQREKNNPQTWLLHQKDQTIELHVKHDENNKPCVLDRGVA
jgi:DNA-directed RNA polymerase subunit H (RpoH/RPB5)